MQPTGSILAVMRASLLCISALMVWDSLSPGTFGAVFGRPIRDWLEVSYLAAMGGSVWFLGIAIYRLLRPPRAWLRNAVHLLLAISWCLVLLACTVLMAVRTGL